MRHEDGAFNPSNVGHGVGRKPAFGSHESRNLRIDPADPTTLIFDQPGDYNIYLSMFQSLPREKSSTSGGGPGGANTLTYATEADAQSASALLQEAKQKLKP